MKDLVARKYLAALVLLTSISVTLLTTPFNSLDPVNLPKLTLLAILSFISIGLVLADRNFLLKRENRSILILAGLFLIQLVIVYLVDNRYWALKFYGAPGRNTGFLAYVCLTFLLLACVRASSLSLIRKYSWVVIGVGLLVGVYGIFQSKGIDFFSFDNPYSSNVFGTFGNPNFQSAFMGMIASTAFTLILLSNLRVYIRLSLVVIVIISIYNMTLSTQQGYINFLSGIAASVLVYLFKTKKLILGWITLIFSLTSFLLVFAAIVNKGPLSQLIYETSLQTRSFYWQGALKIMFGHPLVGTGMDSFGEWYRRSWSGVSGSTDAAHNIPLDIGANGGFPLLLIYLFIIGLTLRAIIRVTRREGSFDSFFSAIVAAWVAYQAQSIISINQLGLGVWGWSLTGLIIGYEINTGADSRVSKSATDKSIHKALGKISALAILSTFISAGIGMLVAVPPYLAATNFYNAIQSGDVKQIQTATYRKPYDRNRFLIFARGLKSNNMESQAIEVLRDAAKVYPDSIDIWSMWVSIPTINSTDLARANKEIQRLDPFRQPTK